MLPIVCWAAKPMISPSTAVEARMPVASRFSSVNWLSAIIARTTRTTTKSRRRRIRRRVLVERETCETAGDMEANLAGDGRRAAAALASRTRTGAPGWRVLGVFLALGAGVVMGIPAAIVGHKPDGDLTTFGNIGVQLATALGFLLVPMAIAAQRGAATMREVLRRLGVRRFRPSALKWMAAAIGAYLLFAVALLGADRRTAAGGHRRGLRADPGPDPADRDRGADQRGDLLPRDAVRRPAGAAAAARRRRCSRA